MNRFYTYYILFSILSMGVVMLSSCRKVIVDTPEKETFLNCYGIGFYKDGKSVFTYSDYLHQICVNTNRVQFRLQTNCQDTCMNVILKDKPHEEGDLIVASLDYEDAGVRIVDQCQFECSRISNGKVWLWDSDTKTGVIILDVF